MTFLRARRLDAARARLAMARDDDTITSIATACGFEHLGRFSAQYRQRFGESPRDTRARAGRDF